MRKYMMGILAVAVLVGLIGCSSESDLGGSEKSASTAAETVQTDMMHDVAAQEGSYTQISMDEAVTMMDEETDYIILDVRRPDEFADKHIPNAINVPNETIGEEEIPELPDKDQMILVYCRSGNRSKQASEKLAALGYTNVYEFGGINDWPGETVGE